MTGKILAAALLGLFCAVSGAQETAGGGREPKPGAAEKAPASGMELRKRHGQAVADLKKKQAEALRLLKNSMKGGSAAEIRAALDKRRAEDKAELKALRDSQRAEAERPGGKRP